MPKRIEFEGKVHEFPDDFTDDEIRRALSSGPQPKQAPAPDKPSFLHGLYETTLKPFVDIGTGMVTAPKETLKNALVGVAQEFLAAPRMLTALSRGDVSEAARIAPSVAMPVVGGAVQRALEHEISGQPERAAGEMTGLALGAAIPAVAGKVVGARVTPGILKTRLTPEGQAAVDFAHAEGIPISAATETGSPVARALQSFTARAPGGAGPAFEATQKTRAAMHEVGGRLAGGPVAPEVAGEATLHAAKTTEAAQAGKATAAYERLREIEARPENVREVPVRTGIPKEAQSTLDDIARSQGGKPYEALSDVDKSRVRAIAERMGTDLSPRPVYERVATPVDMKPVKAAVREVYDSVSREMPLTKRQESVGLQAMQNILDSKDVLPASVADADLGAIKAILREPISDKNRWLVKKVLDEFAPKVDEAVARAGPDALDALKEGRQWTKAKYATRETMDAFPDEPVKLFNKLTQAKDANINLLRDVKKAAPDAMPTLGRGVLQGLLDSALRVEPGGPGPQSAVAQWGRLGQQTKNILFTPEHQEHITQFLRLAEMEARNPNPSGTASTLLSNLNIGAIGGEAMAAATGHPAVFLKLLGGHLSYYLTTRAVAKLLWTPEGTRLLTEGLRIPASAASAARSEAIANRILAIAGADANPAGESSGR